MKEILFRGKRVDGYGWIEGDLIHDEAENNRPRINIAREYSTGTFFHAQAPRVVLETVGQFTGLTDKNGKKIFEGDILKVHYEDYSSKKEFVGYIKYIVGAYGISYGQDRHFLEFAAMTSYIRGYEVIGNIYDNPELMEAE